MHTRKHTELLGTKDQILTWGRHPCNLTFSRAPLHCPRFSSQGFCFPRATAVCEALAMENTDNSSIQKKEKNKIKKDIAEFLLACSKNFAASAASVWPRNRRWKNIFNLLYSFVPNAFVAIRTVLSHVQWECTKSRILGGKWWMSPCLRNARMTRFIPPREDIQFQPQLPALPKQPVKFLMIVLSLKDKYFFFRHFSLPWRRMN